MGRLMSCETLHLTGTVEPRVEVEGSVRSLQLSGSVDVRVDVGGVVDEVLQLRGTVRETATVSGRCRPA